MWFLSSAFLKFPQKSAKEKNSKKSKIVVDNRGKMSIIVKVFRRGHSQIAELCKGSTADSDSVCEGSNPSPAAR